MTRRNRWFISLCLVGISLIVLTVIFRFRDQYRMQGTWVGENVSVNGVLRLTVEGDLAVLEHVGSSRPLRTYFRLDPVASPKRIVIWSADAPHLRPREFLGFAYGPPSPTEPNSEAYGAYEISGDRLRICVLVSSHDPTLFASAYDTYDFHRE
jgi:uncharacterized protein (TIGR03067 family)